MENIFTTGEVTEVKTREVTEISFFFLIALKSQGRKILILLLQTTPPKMCRLDKGRVSSYLSKKPSDRNQQMKNFKLLIYHIVRKKKKKKKV